jgi:hypothetical protein
VPEGGIDVESEVRAMTSTLADTVTASAWRDPCYGERGCGSVKVTFSDRGNESWLSAR